jgi:ABC-type dipeptide/oligopeptide/nickel transport system permease subunit
MRIGQEENTLSEFTQTTVEMGNQSNLNEEKLIKMAVLKMNGHILGFVIGIISALGLFVATNWLVLKGGENVGQHLSLLSHFFIGYSVTFLGSFIGSAYSFVVGYISGLIVGWVYNAIMLLKN